MTTIKVQLLYDDAILPVRKHSNDSGIDIYAYEEKLIKRFNPDDESESHRTLIKTGIAITPPENSGVFIWDRSSVASINGVHCVGGVIDRGYIGELKIALVNLSNKDFLVRKGDRIAQAVVLPVLLSTIEQVNSLELTERGDSGFGSTGNR